MKNKHIQYIASVFILATAFAFLSFAIPSFAQEADNSLDLISQQLKQYITELEKQILELQAQLEVVKKAEVRISEITKFTQTLQRGVTGEEVKELQGFLKQFPDIYPEGLVTGYFGTLTEAAIKRFQDKQGIEVVGIVGPKTRAKLNELTVSGVITPPGAIPATPAVSAVPTNPATPAIPAVPPSGGGGSGGGGSPATPAEPATPATPPQGGGGGATPATPATPAIPAIPSLPPSEFLLYRLDGEISGDMFGHSMAVDDINGDGKEDVIIGAHQTMWSGDYSGSAFVYSGADGSLLHRFDGAPTGRDNFGYSVAGGDIDGDGRADIIVGAVTADPNGKADAGSVFIYSGADYSLIHRFDGEMVDDGFGGKVAVGDINGDGINDIVIGARGTDPNGLANVGSIYVYSGNDYSLLHRFDGSYANNWLFGELFAMGDINGDGKDDIIISVTDFNTPINRSCSNSMIYSWSTYVYSGADYALLHRIDGLDRIHSISSGDINSDGKDDIIIGSHTAEWNGCESGSVYIYSGADYSLLRRLDGESAHDYFGISVNAVGDVNKDGKNDIAVGALSTDLGGITDVGSAYIYSGTDGSILYRFDGETTNDQFGYQVLGAGDINGNGVEDVVVSATYADQNGINQAGGVYIYSLPQPSKDTTPPVISDIQVTDITENSATITWTTDEPATSEVRWAVNSLELATTTNSATGTDNATNHSVSLTGLSSGTTYYYVVVSRDSSSNTATSSEQSFTTILPPPTEWQKKNMRITNAPGSSLYPSIAWNGNSYGVVWSDSRDGGEPEVFFAQVDSSGNKIVQDLQLSNSDTLSYHPKIVWTGTEYGILWANRYSSEIEASDCGLQFIRIDQSGNKQSDVFDVTSDNYGCPSNPTLVWNGSSYGVFWSGSKQSTQRTFYAQLDSNGNKIGSDIQLTDIDAGYSRVIWDGSAYAIIASSTYLVRYDVDGARIGSDTSLMAPIVAATELRNWGLIWDGNAYGVLFQGYDSSGFRQQYYIRTDSSGSALVSGVQITNNTAVDGGLLPGYAVWGNDVLAIVYNVSDSHLYFSEINLDGSIKTDFIQVDNSINAEQPYIIWNGSQYAVVWSDSRHAFNVRGNQVFAPRDDNNIGNTEIYLAISDSEGNELSDVAIPALEPEPTLILESEPEESILTPEPLLEPTPESTEENPAPAPAPELEPSQEPEPQLQPESDPNPEETTPAIPILE